MKDQLTPGVIAVSLLLSGLGSTAHADAGSTAAASPRVPRTTAASRHDLLVDKRAIAAQGYDVVSYVDDGKAVRGRRNLAAHHGGATYLFASKAHRRAFLSNPSRYLPEFGGYCAFAVAQKQAKVQPNPETFRIQNGRLLLFFNGPFEGKIVDTSAMWDESPDSMLIEADSNWPSVSAK